VSPFVLDANLSPETGAYLVATFGFDVVHLTAIGRGDLADEEIVDRAWREGRVIITFDLDFGEIYRRRNGRTFGAIVHRLDDQTVESVNRALDRFFRHEATSIALDSALVVVEAERSRVTRADEGCRRQATSDEHGNSTPE
jgi:predicted nuclease of predicted toxin-antitoxin system